MDALTENDILFSNTENNTPVLSHSAEVQQPSVEEMVERGGQLLLRSFNMIRNIERLQSEGAFDEVCKILLIVVLQDKQEINPFIIKTLDTEHHVQSLFNEAKRQHNYKVFEETEIIKISVPTFKQVLSELIHFDWADTHSRILVFEGFLTGISRNIPELITTPQSIVDYMVDILDPQEGDRICDPCCGNGGFLIKSYGHTKNTINKFAKQNPLAYNIYGADINERAIKNVKMRLFMHDIEGANMYRADGLFNNGGIEENKFDIVLAQPPFGISNSSISYELMPKYVFNPKQLDFIFVLRCLDILKEGGKMGIILKESILSDKRFKEERHFIESQAKILQITSLPANTFSTHTSIKTSIIFFQKLAYKEKKSSILFADVKEVGVTLRSDKPTNNELILLAKEYKNVLANPKIDNQTLLKDAQYEVPLSNWNMGYLTNVDIERNNKYNYQKLSSLLIKKNRDGVKINDLEEYKRVKVKFNNEVVLRDEVKGAEILTKKQFRIIKGQLIVARIGASNGALGIVPDELDNAIVTSDFLTYTIDKNKILPEYLVLILADGRFTNYFLESATGSVMHRLNEDLFLNLEIPVPPLSEQIELCQKIMQLKRNIKELE